MDKLFRTDNLALCPFLEMQGLRYSHAEWSVGRNNKSKVYFIFYDDKGAGRDLEISFRFSDFKKYRDLGFFYRAEIEKLRREIVLEDLKKNKE